MLLPPWDELDRGVRDWVRGVIVGCLVGSVATSMLWLAVTTLAR